MRLTRHGSSPGRLSSDEVGAAIQADRSSSQSGTPARHHQLPDTATRRLFGAHVSSLEITHDSVLLRLRFRHRRRGANPQRAFPGSSLPATELGAVAIRAALERSHIPPASVGYVIMGQVVTAGAGQDPARIAAIEAGIPMSVPAITINKVCLAVSPGGRGESGAAVARTRRSCTGRAWPLAVIRIRLITYHLPWLQMIHSSGVGFRGRRSRGRRRLLG